MVLCSKIQGRRRGAFFARHAKNVPLLLPCILLFKATEEIQHNRVELLWFFHKRMMCCLSHDHFFRSWDLYRQLIQRIWSVPLAENDERRHPNLRQTSDGGRF